MFFAAQLQLFSLPRGAQSTSCSDHPECRQPLCGSRRWYGILTPGPQVEDWGPDRLRDPLGGSHAAHDRAGDQTLIPGQLPQKGQPFPLEGKYLSEVWLCGCLQTERALSAALCNARWLMVSVFYGWDRCWSSPVFRKTIFYSRLLLSLVNGVRWVSSSGLHLQNLALLFLIIQLKNDSSPFGLFRPFESDRLFPNPMLQALHFPSLINVWQPRYHLYFFHLNF